MTKKRDLKRRVRERQEQTGESYVTARRHVLAARTPNDDDDDDDDEPTEPGVAVPVPPPTVTGPLVEVRDPLEPGTPASAQLLALDRTRSPRQPNPPMSVVELIDVTDDAARLGFKCRFRAWPNLAAQVSPTTVLARLRDVLLATSDDPTMALFVKLAVYGQLPEVSPRRWTDIEAYRRFLRRIRAGLGGVSDDGTMLALSIVGERGLIHTLCTASRTGVGLMLVDEELFEPIPITLPDLFAVCAGERFPVGRDEFVIGRARGAALQLRDPRVSRRHAAVIYRDGNYYIKDLGSTDGVHYRGMRIDNKRIAEGDEFHIAGYAIRFTFKPEA